MGASYAIRITEENKWAIASEHPKFDQEEFDKWIAEHGTGYFVRNPGEPFDCHYLDDIVFREVYFFESADRGELFRPILKQ